MTPEIKWCNIQNRQLLILLMVDQSEWYFYTFEPTHALVHLNKLSVFPLKVVSYCLLNLMFVMRPTALVLWCSQQAFSPNDVIACKWGSRLALYIQGACSGSMHTYSTGKGEKSPDSLQTELTSATTCTSTGSQQKDVKLVIIGFRPTPEVQVEGIQDQGLTWAPEKRGCWGYKGQRNGCKGHKRKDAEKVVTSDHAQNSGHKHTH